MREDHARTPPSRAASGPRLRRSGRGDPHSQCRRPAPRRYADRGRATLPRSSPHREPSGTSRRRQSAAAGRGFPRAPGCALPRRAPRVRPPRSRVPATGDRAAARNDRPGALLLRVPRRLPARRGLEPVSLRLARKRSPRLPLRRRRRLPEAARCENE